MNRLRRATTEGLAGMGRMLGNAGQAYWDYTKALGGAGRDIAGGMYDLATGNNMPPPANALMRAGVGGEASGAVTVPPQPTNALTKPMMLAPPDGGVPMPMRKPMPQPQGAPVGGRSGPPPAAGGRPAQPDMKPGWLSRMVAQPEGGDNRYGGYLGRVPFWEK